LQLISQFTFIEISMTKSALIPLDAALEQLLGFVICNRADEWVSTFEADNRILAEDVFSKIEVPGFDNSAMDGFAFNHADFLQNKGTLKAGKRIPAGFAPDKLVPGHADRIFTGAPVPHGADTVVMQEDCEVLNDGTIKILSHPNAGQCIRFKGEDIALNSKVLSRGQRLDPAALGLVASIGLSDIRVATRPKVALFSTGDELVMPGEVEPEKMKPGAIFNSNRFFLKTLLLRLGCCVTDFGILPDQLDKTKEAFSNASMHHDLILTSGGVSVGEEDHVKPAIQSLGKLDIWSLAIKPGKPFAYGQVLKENQITHFIGLPGNPVSSLITFLLLAKPFILKLQGATELNVPTYTMRADFGWLKADKRREFLRVKRNLQGGLDLFHNQSSGVLTSAVWGDGVVDNPPGNVINPGDSVNFIPFSNWMS